MKEKKKKKKKKKMVSSENISGHYFNVLPISQLEMSPVKQTLRPYENYFME
jgi:hypothetical protein